MDIKNLKQKPLWQMTGEEFLFLQQSSCPTEMQQPTVATDTPKKYVYGLLGIAVTIRPTTPFNSPLLAVLLPKTNKSC